MKSLKEKYKFEKWDLFFCDKKINKIKEPFVLYMVSNSITFESWIEEEEINEKYTNELFKCVWRNNNK